MSPSVYKPNRVGIIGAGTMGSGIALAALLAGLEVSLQDVSAEMLERAESYLAKYLERKEKMEALDRVLLTDRVSELADADIWIEAVPEDLNLKREIFAAMEAAAKGNAVLATNTSTLSVTEIASAVEKPGRVVGMHFFNPAAVLPLVEVVRAATSEPEAVDQAVSTAEALGKTPVVVEDSPGFIVNRVARPFYGEGLRLLGEGAAGIAAIDAVVASAGFPMGPFELMDLIGLDVNLEAARSVYEQMFHDPRFRPHPIQQRKVNAGELGRKSGRGFYHYTVQGEKEEPVDMEVPDPMGEGALWVSAGRWDHGVRTHLTGAGFNVVDQAEGAQAAFVLAGRGEGLRAQVERVDGELPADRPIFCQLNDVTWSEVAGWLDHPARLVGFDALFFAEAGAACLVGPPELEGELREAVERVIRAAGRAPVWVEERPALVLSRIVCALINEAAFAVEEGIAEAATIDRAMRLGVSYPKGPLRWGEELGWARVVEVLDHMQREYREPRYRAAPWLRRKSRYPGRDKV